MTIGDVRAACADPNSHRIARARQFRDHGVVIVTHAVGDSDIALFANLMAGGSGGHPSGVLGAAACAAIAGHGALAAIAAELIAASFPAGRGETLASGDVFLARAIAFDPAPREAEPWRAAWHQDVAGCGAGVDPRCHETQLDLVTGGVTLRVHVDDCDADSGPLEVVPGSHRAGILNRLEARLSVARTGSSLCLADRGDIVAVSPLTLRRRQRARTPGKRARVLLLDYVAGPAGTC